MRPVLKAGLLPVWRDRETVQIGIDPRRAVALTGMSHAALVLGLLDGSRDRDQVIAAARERGIPEPVTDQILTLLALGGALDDFPAAAIRAVPQDRRRRLAAELAAASLARGHSDAGAAALVRRDAARVQIYGSGRVAAAIADILGTSGIGRVATSGRIRADDWVHPDAARSVRARRPPRPGAASSASPGAGRTPAPHRGQAPEPRAGQAPEPRAGQAPEPRAGQAPEPAGGPPAGRDRRDRDSQRPLPDLAILIGYQSPELAASLMAADVPHLAVAAAEAIGVVGPLVRPGRTACLRCLDLTRASLDPAWPLILAQLVGRTADPPACDAALAAAVAAQAAAQALAFIDRAPPAGPAENGTLELVLPGWQWRRRTWPAHASCGCARPAHRPPARAERPAE